MTELLYQKDMLLAEFSAEVAAIDGNKIELDRTAFYPQSGGIATDKGTIERAGEFFQVVMVRKEGGKIVHELDKPGLAVGDKIVGKIDWPRREILSKYHTAAHVLIGIMSKEGILCTGNQMDIDGGRMDLDWEGFTKEGIQKVIDEANGLIGKDLPVKIYELSRDEVVGRPEFVKLAKGLLDLDRYRIVDIVGFDAQPDGGCHVASLSKIGKLEFTGYESKGKRNKRFRFVIKD
jgi:misacylated tRNA(Ala) deacylase